MHIMQILRLQLVATMVTISRESILSILSKYIIRIATNVNIVFACVRIDMNLKPSFRFTQITGISYNFTQKRGDHLLIIWSIPSGFVKNNNMHMISNFHF